MNFAPSKKPKKQTEKRKSKKQRMLQLFYAYDFYLAKDFPVLDFYTESQFSFKVFHGSPSRMQLRDGTYPSQKYLPLS
jgi:hypothetical protein